MSQTVYILLAFDQRELPDIDKIAEQTIRKCLSVDLCANFKGGSQNFDQIIADIRNNKVFTKRYKNRLLLYCTISDCFVANHCLSFLTFDEYDKTRDLESIKEDIFVFNEVLTFIKSTNSSMKLDVFIDETDNAIASDFYNVTIQLNEFKEDLLRQYIKQVDNNEWCAPTIHYCID